MSTREAVFPDHPHALYRLHGYSPAVRTGDLLFVSGMVGAHPDGSPEPDPRTQMRMAFDSLRAVLAAAGGSLDDVIDTTYFMTDPEAHVGILVEMIAAEFPADPKPSLTAVGVNWLAGFMFEIKAVARIPKR